MAYNLMKRIIKRGDYDKNNVMEKLDTYLAGDRITVKQYKELVAMLE